MRYGSVWRGKAGAWEGYAEWLLILGQKDGEKCWEQACKIGKAELSPQAVQSHCCGHRRGNWGMAAVTGLQNKSSGCVLPLVHVPKDYWGLVYNLTSLGVLFVIGMINQSSLWDWGLRTEEWEGAKNGGGTTARGKTVENETVVGMMVVAL